MRDKYNTADVYLTFEHYKVHRGEMYHAHHYITVTSASIYEIIMIVGSLPAHINVEVQGSGQLLMGVYEGPTVTAAATGTAITPLNMERPSAKTCLSKFAYGGTYSINAATVLFRDIVPGGNSPSTRFGGSASRDTEWVLKASTVYLFRFTNQAGTTVTSSFNTEFYELSI